jgi:beta-lactamase regulating signal transducer with metallopeptidase domain
MKEILLTSSILILALLVLRQVFRKTISRRVQYALWALVLVRLLVPVNLPAMEHNVLTAAQPVGQTVTASLEQRQVYVLPVGRTPISNDPQADGQAPGTQVSNAESFGYNVVSQDGSTVTKYAEKLSLSQVLRLVWYAGIAVMTCWLVISNLRFWRMLCKVRTPYSVEDCKYPVYLVEEGLPSPCLFGLFRPAIYLTPAAVSSPDSLRHVLAHETTHARHLDPLWSLLRGVCLAVYWFDPLVWAAAVASKRDCELACDEGALKQLGENERIAYGRTLLALIPVVKRPTDPMLSATTMTSGKRQLKDRITRIAENRQTASIALFAVVALAVVVCAVTFTGAKTTAAQTDDQPLTADELRYFNEEFFNVGYPDLRNQFLSSTYESPEDIDLFELFYCGTDQTTQADAAERQAVADAGYDGFDPEIDLTKITVAQMDAVLTEYTGLTLAETNQFRLDDFTYLADYDAYYHFHGDTNYRASVDITAGEWKDGLICLYYRDDFLADGWKCVTLRQVEDGYQFVSNLTCDKPAVPTIYPEGKPAMTVSLTDLEPYEPEAVTVVRHSEDAEKRLDNYMAAQGAVVTVYRSTDGNLYAAIVDSQTDDQGYDCFLTLPDEDYTITLFQDLFGHDGVRISYYGLIDGNQYGKINDFYYVTDAGAPVLLARAYGEVKIVDLDGDGQEELAASDGGPAQLFFQRNGQLYQADVEGLVSDAWPEVQYFYFGYWDVYSRSLPMSGSIISDDAYRTATRTLYFDGESLLLYKDNGTYTDHVRDSIDAPTEVLTAAKAQVLEQYDWWQNHSGSMSYVDDQWQDMDEPAQWDDWKISDLSREFDGAATSQRPDLQVEVYDLGYLLHTTTPEKVTIAGAMYIDEDNWVGGFHTDYLVFQVKDGERLLVGGLATDVGCEGPIFRGQLARMLMEYGLLQPSEIDQEYLYYMFGEKQSTFLNDLGEFDETEQLKTLQSLVNYADSGNAGEDSDLFGYGLENLEWNSNYLTDNGRTAYERLLAIVSGKESDPADSDSVIVDKENFVPTENDVLAAREQATEGMSQQQVKG